MRTYFTGTKKEFLYICWKKVICDTRTKTRTLDEEGEVAPLARATVKLAADSGSQLHNLHRVAAFTPSYNKELFFTSLDFRLRACETLWSAREMASVALSAGRDRRAENVFHMLLKDEITEQSGNNHPRLKSDQMTKKVKKSKFTVKYKNSKPDLPQHREFHDSHIDFIFGSSPFSLLSAPANSIFSC